MEEKSNRLKSENGITLVALILTIAILLILASVSIKTGMESLDNTRLQGFYTQLEIIQKRVDDIAATNESYIDNEGNTIYLKEQGSDLTDAQKASLESILTSEGINIETTNFRYFTVEDLRNSLNLLEMEYNVFIDFTNRVIVAENGLQLEDKTYYILENTTYFVEQNTNKNTGTIESLSYNITQYSGNKYKISITPSNTIGDLGGTEYVKYKKTTTKYWETSTNTDIIVELSIEYNIVYIDSNNNTLEKTIIVELDDSNNPTVTEI